MEDHSVIYLNETNSLHFGAILAEYTGFLGTKSTSIRDCVGWSVRRSVGPLVRPSVPTMQLRGKLVMLRLLREEEEEEENWLRRDSFAPRD
jgi:hypothetical protein